MCEIVGSKKERCLRHILKSLTQEKDQRKEERTKLAFLFTDAVCTFT